MILLAAGQFFTAAAQVQNGETVGDLRFEAMVNAPVKKLELSKLKGKFVILDFWATWCGSCIEAMPHLSALQKKYGRDLQVVLVTEEMAQRAAQFVKARPTGLWIDSDTAGAFAKVFPHRVIPHTVLISREGKLVAITNPEAINNSVMDSLLANQTVHLTEKKDLLLGPNELLKQRFYMPAYVTSAFTMEGPIKGLGGFSTRYVTDSSFVGRRFTAVNVGLFNLYSTAFGDFSSNRVIDSIPPKDRKAVYCVDIVTATKEQLLPTLRDELLKRFDVQAKVKPMVREVYVLKVIDPVKARSIPQNQTHVRTYYSRHGEIDQQHVSMNDFALFLEEYGDLESASAPVLNETGLPGTYDIKFSFRPEDKQSLLSVLAGMGLGVEKVKKEVEMLYLYKEK